MAKTLIKEGQLKVWHYYEDDDIDVEYGGCRYYETQVSSVKEGIALARKYNSIDVIFEYDMSVYHNGKWKKWADINGEELFIIADRLDEEEDD